MSVEDPKPMSGDDAQSKLEAIRARFRARSAASVDAALQAVTGGDQAPVNPDQNVSKDIAPSVDTSKQRAPRRKGGATRSTRAKRTGKRVSAHSTTTVVSQTSESKDLLLDKLTDLLSDSDAGAPAVPESLPTKPATPEPITAAVSDVAPSPPTPDQAKGETDPYADIQPGQVWSREIETAGTKGTQTLTITELTDSGDVVVRETRTFQGATPWGNDYPTSLPLLRDKLKQENFLPGAPVSPDATPTPSEQWTEERLWRELPEGEFVLQNNNGEPRYYRRQGQELYNRLGKAVPLNDVLDKLKSGRWHIMDLSVPPTERGGDVLKGRDPKGYDELYEGDEWVLLGSDGKEKRRIVINLFQFINFPTTIGTHGKIVNVQDSALPEMEIDANSDIKNLVRHKDISPNEMRATLEAQGYEIDDVNKNLPPAHDVSIEELRRELREQGFVLSKAGGGRSEQPREGAPTPEVKPEKPEPEGPTTLAEVQAKVSQSRTAYVQLERIGEGEKSGWQRAKQVLGAFIGKEPPVSPEVSIAMEQYKRALTELFGLKIESIKHSDLKGEALRQAIASIVREFDFTEGEDLDEARRKARLGEGKTETLTEKWHKVLEGAKQSENIYTLKDGYSEITGQKEWYNKWALLWGAAKLTGEAGVRGAMALGAATYRAGIQYNRLTDTKAKKIAMAAAGAGLAGVLVFSGGGAAAAAAGVALAAKRFFAAAGAAAAVKGVADAWAQRSREQKAQESAEGVLRKLKLTQADEFKEFVNNPDTSIAHPTEAVLSPEKIRELEDWFKQSTIDNVGKRGAKRRMGRLWRNTVAGVAGGALALAAPGALAHAGEAAREAAGGSGAVGRVAERLQNVASAPSPAAAASAAEASASAPSGAASAATGRVGVVGGPGSGSLIQEATEDRGGLRSSGLGEAAHAESSNVNQALRTSYSRGIDEVLDRAGRAESVGRALAETGTIARGDTIWKYGVEAAKTAGLDEAGQKRFSGALTQALREKLSMMSPEEAAKYGFYPNRDGLLTPDYIRANDKLDLVGLLGQEKMAALMEQAETGRPSAASVGTVVEERATGVYGDRPANMEDSVVWNKRDYAPGEMAETVGQGTKSTAVVEAANDAKFNPALEAYDARVRNLTDPVLFLAENPDMKLVLRGAAEKIHQEIFGLNPGEGGVPTEYDFALNGDKLGKTQVSQVLRDLDRFKLFDIGYDRNKNPLHMDQMKALAEFMRATEKAFGPEIATPKAGESITYYVGRMATAALRTGKTIRGFYKSNSLLAAA